MECRIKRSNKDNGIAELYARTDTIEYTAILYKCDMLFFVSLMVAFERDNKGAISID